MDAGWSRAPLLGSSGARLGPAAPDRESRQVRERKRRHRHPHDAVSDDRAVVGADVRQRRPGSDAMDDEACDDVVPRRDRRRRVERWASAAGAEPRPCRTQLGTRRQSPRRSFTKHAKERPTRCPYVDLLEDCARSGYPGSMPASRPLLEDDGQPSSGSPLHIGQVVNGKYRIERQIGRGGMGIVLAATHLQLEHLVAIKVMRRDVGMDAKALDRLLTEARSAARIRSEHVARVLDVGTLDNGSPFIVMEYLDGENLADLLDREGALEIDQAVSFLMQCCVALAEVHVAEMVHRDLKPGNLFIARLPDGSPSVKIVDFGISKQIGSARDGAATTSPQVLGSPYYMSPEQMRAEPVDERSDIWGLGAILFEMLTGRPPFIGDTLPEVYAAVLNEAPPPVDSLRAGVAAGLDDVVQRCLEKDPAQRFCDVADLAEALAPYVRGGAQSVDRVTRILMNPDAARGRSSLLPGGFGPVPGPGVGADPGRAALKSGILGTDQRMEGMMAGDDEDEGGANRRSTVGADGPPGATLLESDAAPRRSDAGWRPSRPPMTAEYAALSATGVRTGRVSRLTRRRVGWLLAGLGLLAAIGLFWVRGLGPSERAGSERRPSQAIVAPVEAARVPPPPAEADRAGMPAQPRVTPLVGHDGSEKADKPPARAHRPRTEVLALEPSPRAKSGSISAVPARGSRAASSAASAPSSASNPAWVPAEDDTSESRAAGSGNSGHVERPHGDDPWNPDAFGDRR
jgi:serine/threonine protein kinase